MIDRMMMHDMDDETFRDLLEAAVANAQHQFAEQTSVRIENYLSRQCSPSEDGLPQHAAMEAIVMLLDLTAGSRQTFCAGSSPDAMPAVRDQYRDAASMVRAWAGCGMAMDGPMAEAAAAVLAEAAERGLRPDSLNRTFDTGMCRIWPDDARHREILASLQDGLRRHLRFRCRTG